MPGKFDTDDLSPLLSVELRETMLAVIPNWAAVDRAVSPLYAPLFELNDLDHAASYSCRSTVSAANGTARAILSHASAIASSTGPASTPP